MTTFSDFFPDNTVLDPSAVAKAGWAASPFPEMLAEEEIRAMAAVLGVNWARLWAWQFGQVPETFDMPDVAVDLGPRWNNSALNLLIGFGNLPFMAWEEEEHEFFVLLGAPELLQAIRERGIFEYSFEDDCGEPAFAGRKARRLAKIADTYTILEGGRSSTS